MEKGTKKNPLEIGEKEKKHLITCDKKNRKINGKE